ncbi:MAG: YceI family protein [Bacteroidota bacterium]
MQNVTKLSLVLALLAIISLLTLNMSFTTADAYSYEGETPGTLTAIGDAGSPQTFTFERWHFASINMPDNDPTQIEAVIEIDITSVVCDWKDLEKSVKKKKDYFYMKKFPKAMVSLKGATLNADSSYTTDAMLSLKGIEKAVAINFTISEEAPYQIEGSALLQRRAFDFDGDGPKEEVPIAFTATLPMK